MTSAEMAIPQEPALRLDVDAADPLPPIRPPAEVGRKWIGEDLTAGIEMLQLLAGKPYAEDLLRVDVSNFGGRVDAKEAHLVLYTRDGSEVRWGRPPAAR